MTYIYYVKDDYDKLMNPIPWVHILGHGLDQPLFFCF